MFDIIISEVFVDGVRYEAVPADGLSELGIDDKTAASLTKAALKDAAVMKIDAAHAGFLRSLTGNSTIEERDTWKTKEEAARAYIADSATPSQMQMLEYEAAGDETPIERLAQIIVGRAEGFQGLIGLAAGLKKKAKKAVALATADTVPMEQVAPALEQIFAETTAQTEAAIAQWKGQANGR